MTIGKDGSPCKHQYMLWTAKRAKCFNFVPINSPEDRQKLAKIAIGEALPLPLHYISLRDPNPTEFYATPVPVPNSDPPEAQDCEKNARLDNACKTTDNQDDNAAEEAVTEACNLICDKLKCCQNKDLEKGMLQFPSRVKSLPLQCMEIWRQLFSIWCK